MFRACGVIPSRNERALLLRVQVQVAQMSKIMVFLLWRLVTCLMMFRVLAILPAVDGLEAIVVGSDCHQPLPSKRHCTVCMQRL
ncbi:uncharacterized protein EI90DRAFT_3065590 [Cantharellus anzutake]|uniref:uncharacterized protein n=1 Tax=Cantharellus anzutake TaxID=1750568 RepID=UPI001905A6BA|nr:uncharacterized protein EI90DRAFT_3065590 [Cantharellus anzutake]KAF8328102.1 hypothetical protein EI90DRAFT_3065590 [Cantharellus anzutake]